MQLYYFVLKAGRHIYPDSEGQEFPDDSAAKAHAFTVARELMRNRERITGHWSIEVCDDYLQPRYEYLFADIDDTLQSFGSSLCGSVRAVARTNAAIGESLRQIDREMVSLRNTISQIDSIISGRPQV